MTEFILNIVKSNTIISVKKILNEVKLIKENNIKKKFEFEQKEKIFEKKVSQSVNDINSLKNNNDKLKKSIELCESKLLKINKENLKFKQQYNIVKYISGKYCEVCMIYHTANIKNNKIYYEEIEFCNICSKLLINCLTKSIDVKNSILKCHNCKQYHNLYKTEYGEMDCTDCKTALSVESNLLSNINTDKIIIDLY